ncbi:unnamed protein product [Linum trigynum]|uniref:Uncharacterized protein n=1 Tax=Linum trigynum TaxID=586398 RepID=A0AAV2GM62_9ROSI
MEKNLNENQQELAGLRFAGDMALLDNQIPFFILEWRFNYTVLLISVGFLYCMPRRRSVILQIGDQWVTADDLGAVHDGVDEFPWDGND